MSRESVERFWLEEPLSLLRSATIIPYCGMTISARLNALTRLVLLISLILWLFCFRQWWLFLFLGLLMIIILYYLDQQTRDNVSFVENYVCRSHSTKKNKQIPVTSKAIQKEKVNSSGFEPYL